jgi:menaquinone-dependent protoporphyrinogen oxidase
MTAGRSGSGPGAFRPRADSVDVVGASSVLVVYASAHGSTKGVAERIAARLAERGARVEVRPVDEVDDIGAYDSVILGSAVYSQSWIPNASEFLRRNADVLADRRVWLFSVGSFGDTHRGIGRLMKRSPETSRRSKKQSIRSTNRVFAGVIERDHGGWSRDCSSTHSAAASATTVTGRKSTRGPTASRRH